MTDGSRRRVYSGGPWEFSIGYARATRVGDHIYVSGTTAMRDGELVGIGDAGAQTEQILSTISRALTDAGTTIADVVRYRIFITDAMTWPDIAAVLTATFGSIHPSGTMVIVAGLIDPRMLVEIEVDAIAGSASPVGPMPS